MADQTIPSIKNLRGNIGIGIAIPTKKLEVSSSGADVTTIKASYNSTNYLELAHNRINAVSSGGNDSILLQTAGTTRATINQVGNVGIGTTSPVSKLTVESSANALADVDEPENHHLLLRNPANDTTEGVGMGFLVSELTNDVGASIVCKRVGNNAQSELQFWNKQNTTSDGVITQSMTIAEDGNVGIGESNPEQKLHIKGDRLRIEESVNARHLDIVPAVSGQPHKFTSTTTGSGYQFENSSGTIAILDANGSAFYQDLTISASNLKLSSAHYVQFGSANARIQGSNGSNYLKFYTGGTERLAITNTEATFSGDLVVTGGLTINGTTTTLNSTTLQVDDKNIELGTVATPSDTTADGGGITLKGASDYTINWTNSTNSWHFNQGITVGVDGTGHDVVFYGDTADRYMTWDQSVEKLKLRDNVMLTLGTHGDLQLSHDGVHGHVLYGGPNNFQISGNTVILIGYNDSSTYGETAIRCVKNGAVSIRHDNSQKFTTDAGGITVTGKMTSDTITTALSLEMFASSGHNYISSQSSGSNLYIRNTGGGQILIRPKTGEDGIKLIPDGAVQLYHDNALKLTTTAGGADVSGTFGTTSINLDGELNFTTNGSKYIDANTLANSNTFNIRHHNPSGNAFQTAFQSAANGATTLYHSGNAKFNTSATGATMTGNLVMGGGQVKFADGGHVMLGDSNDLRLYHSGSSYIDNITNDLIIRNTAASKDIIFYSNNGTSTIESLRIDGSGQDLNSRLNLHGGDASLYPYITGFVAPQNPEGHHIKCPYFFNDLAYARLRGATVTVTVTGGSSPSTTNIDRMLDASTYFWSVSTSGVSEIVITMEDLPKNFTHTTHMGITFGNEGWRAKNVKLEAYYNSQWNTLKDVTDQKEEYVHIRHNTGGNAQTKLRWTLSNFQTTSMRIASIYCYNYNANGMSDLYVTRDGGSLYDDVRFEDNVKATFGDSDDLQIYHSSSDNNNFIESYNGRNLMISANGISLKSAAGENMITATGDGAVSLYHDNTTRLGTTSSGVAVTGNLSASSLTVNGSPQAGEVRFSATGINSSTYTTLCTVAGNNLASIIDMTITGTSNNVVLNSSFEILVNHSQDIHVKSVSGDYKEVTLRITSDNNEDFSIEAKHNGSTTTTIEVCIFPRAGETITPTSTDPNYTGTEYEHTATEGFRFGGTDGTTESSNLIVDGRIGIGTTSPDAWLSVVKDNDNSGDQFLVADTEGVSPAVRTYTHGGSPAGLILNHYYAVGGSSNEYMRYADFVANVGNGGGTTMRFITKNAANTYSTTVIDNNGNVGIGTTTPSRTLHVVDSAGPTIKFERSSNSNLEFQFGTTNASILGAGEIQFRANGATSNSFIINHTQIQSNAKLLVNTNSGIDVHTNDTGTIIQSGNSSATSTPDQFFVNHSAANVDMGNNRGNIKITKGILNPMFSDQGGGLGLEAMRWSYYPASSDYYLSLATEVPASGVVRYHWNMKNNGTAYDDVMVFDRGNVQIGGTDLTAKLSIRDDGSLTQDIVHIKGGGSSGDFDMLKVEANNGDDIFRVNAQTYHVLMPDSDTKVGIGTTSPVQKLQVNGNIYAAGGGHFFVDNDKSLTAVGDLRLRTNNGTTAVFIDTNQNVGIGTTSPQKALEISAAGTSGGGVMRLTSTGETSAGDAVGKIEFYNNDSTDHTAGVMASIKAIAGPSGGEGHLQFLTDMPSEGAEANQVALHLHSNANVGIGTTSPTSKLEVSGMGAHGINISQDLTASTLSGRLFLSNGTTNQACTLFNSGGTLRFATGGHIGNSSGDTRMTLLANGKLGVGTTSPLGTVHIFTADAGAAIATNTSHDDLIIENGGNCGIQLSGPASSYQYLAFGDTASANQGYVRYYHTDNRMDLRAGGTDTLSLVGGNVGIGTTSPVAKLDVNGQISSDAFGPWYSTSTYVYDSTNGVRYFWNLLGTLPAAGGKGSIEYEAKDDENYPHFVKGIIGFGSFTGGSYVSTSIQHDQQTADYFGVQVRIDTSRRIWIRIPNCDWSHFFRFRVHVNSGSFTTNTSWSTGTTRYDTHTTAVPPNSSSDILSGQNLRSVDNDVTGTVPTYDNFHNFGRLRARNRMQSGNGFASAPAYGFTSGTNTGMYWDNYDTSPQKDQINFSVDGTRRLRVNEAGTFVDGNSYVANGYQFRTFQEWSATTGGTGYGFKFRNTADAIDSMTISYAGNAVTAGSITSTSGNFCGSSLNLHTAGNFNYISSQDASKDLIIRNTGSGKDMVLQVTSSGGTAELFRLRGVNSKEIVSSANFEIRNGSSARHIYLYETYTDSSNYERSFFKHDSSFSEIGTEAAGTGTASGLKLKTAGADRVTVLSGGNVGIGTTSPSKKLHIDGDIKVKNSGKLFLWNDNDNNYLDYQNWIASTGNAQLIRNTGAGGIKLKSTSLEVVVTSGVGIGTTSPSQKLDVEGVIKQKVYTVAYLPTPGSSTAGARAFVSDSAYAFSSSYLGYQVSGGGSNFVPVYSDGNYWYIG